MKEIKLTQGKVAIVDDTDYEKVKFFKWCASKDNRTYYAVSLEKINGKWKRVKMHRLILGLKRFDGIIVDHCDGNGVF